MGQTQIWLIRERIKHCTKLLNQTPTPELREAIKEEIRNLKVDLADAILAANDSTFDQVINLVAVK